MGVFEPFRILPGYLTTYAALIFDSIQQHSTFGPITILIYNNPNSRLSTHHAARRYPLALEEECFLWDQALAKVRKIFPHWDKRDPFCRDRKDILHGFGEAVTISLMLNESLSPCQLAYSMY